MPYFFGTIVFLFGSALGSFLSVVANRYNTGLSFFKGRSFCFSCNTELAKKDLFPIFSFLFLKGRCRYCGSQIPKETLFVELLMGLLTALAAFKIGIFDNFQLIFNFLILTSIFGIILLISIYDLKHFIIPDSFLVSFFVLSFIYLSFSPSSKLLALSFSNLIVGILLMLPFLLMFLISRGQWLGFGDVKYIAVIGFFLGASQGVSAVILGFWIGALFALLALLSKKLLPHIHLPLLKNNLTIKSEIPFGPFLSIGIIISFYFNADLFQIHSLFNFF